MSVLASPAVPMTGAERQRRWRLRHAERVAVLERENAELRAEVERLGRLAAAVTEVGRWSQPAASGPACPHPAAVVDNGLCGACGAEVDAW